MYFSEMKKNTINSLLIIFAIYLFLNIFNFFLILSTERIEFCLSFGFSIMTIFYYIRISHENIVKNHKIETLSHFMYITNLFLILSFLTVSLDNFVFQVYYDMTNAYVSNIILLFVFAIILASRLFDYENYLMSAYTDLTLENTLSYLKKMPPRAMPKGTIKIEGKQKEVLISHEIGHVMMLLPALNEDDEIMVSIIQEKGSLGYVLSDINKKERTKENIEHELRHYLGGVIAEIYESEIKNENVEEMLGRSHDMALYSKTALEYLRNGFNIHESYISMISEEDGDIVKEIDKFNARAYKALHLRMIAEGYDIIKKNPDIYEELKLLLEKKLVLYIEDIKPYLKKFNERRSN